MLQYFSIQSTKRDAIQQHDYTTAELPTEDDLKTCYFLVVLDDYYNNPDISYTIWDLRDMQSYSGGYQELFSAMEHGERTMMRVNIFYLDRTNPQTHFHTSVSQR